MAGRRRTFLSAVMAHQMVPLARRMIDAKHVTLHQSQRPIRVTLPSAWQVTTDTPGSVGITSVAAGVNNVWQVRGLLPVAFATITFLNPGPGFQVAIKVTVAV